MNIKISVGLFKMQITGPISRNANCIETEIGTEISLFHRTPSDSDLGDPLETHVERHTWLDGIHTHL